MLNENDIKELCANCEHDLVDYKGHIHFSKSDDEQKSKLLKDILAFANTCSTSSGYILHGVQETKDKKGEIVGPKEFLDFAQIGQFIDSKTNKKIKFDIYTVSCDSKSIQVIEILPQYESTPFWIKSDYGTVRKNIVYYRSKSGTNEMNPDEIIQMDQNKNPEIELSITSPWLNKKNRIIIFETKNPDNNQFIQWFNEAMRYIQLNINLCNKSTQFIERIDIETNFINHKNIIEDYQFPEWPEKDDYSFAPMPEIPFSRSIEQSYLNPRESYNNFDEINFYLKGINDIELEITLFGSKIRNPLKYYFKFPVLVFNLGQSIDIEQHFYEEHDRDSIIKFISNPSYN